MPGEQKKRTNISMAFLRIIGVRLVLGLFFVSALMVLLISTVVNAHVNRYVAMVTESTQNHLMAAAQASAKLISAEVLDRYHTKEDTETREYQEIKTQLIQFAEKYQVLYVYYWREYENGFLQYIVDNDTDPETQVGPESIYEIEEIALSALAGNVGVTDLGSYTPTWDGLITGYAPVYDKEGNFYCVAGVDISDEFILIQRQNSRGMMLLQIISIAVSVISGALSMLLYRRKVRQIEEAHDKLQYFNNNLRRAFSTYLSEDVVEDIVSDPTHLQLGGINRDMTAMFTDVENFTHIAEMLAPEQLIDLLNYYLSTMSDVILEQKGTIDKYAGDGIMSFFGAPLKLSDHAIRACISAIIMKRQEKEVNRHIAESKICSMPLFTRIGINSGEMVVGNMGTQKKMNYTIVSNAVNLASRLEGVNKYYKTWILASESTVMKTGDSLLARRLDRIRVAGIHEPVSIYEVLETKADASAAQHELAYFFNEALSLFESGMWKDAEGGFHKVLKVDPGDGPSILYLSRCQQYQLSPPTKNWDGVFNLKEK